MTNAARHLAQFNIGRFRYATDDPRMADFMNNLDLVNALAERSPGFVWRLQDDSGNATQFRPFPDPQMAVNLSVWDSVEALERYVSLSQELQTKALRFAARSCRQRFPRCGGFIIWMGHDAFPCASSIGLIDYDRNPRPACRELEKVFKEPLPPFKSAA